MKKLMLTTAALLALATTAATADTFTYACKVEDGPRTHLYSAVLDLTKHTITWRGKIYTNVKPTFEDVDGKDCAKECFGNSKNIHLSTATQGVATLSILAGVAPGGDGAEQFDCDLVHK
jgi:hypothetical protein